MNKFLRFILFLGPEPVDKAELAQQQTEALIALSNYNGGDQAVLDTIHSEANAMIEKSNTKRRKKLKNIGTAIIVLLLIPFLSGCAAMFKAMGIDSETSEQMGNTGEGILASAATGNLYGAGLGILGLIGLYYGYKKKKKGK